MISFKHKVFSAELQDLGYSGRYVDNEFLGYFTTSEEAWNIAIGMAGDVQKSGKKGTVLEKTVEINIYETSTEYFLQVKKELAASARSKLSPAELASLKDEFDGS